MTEPTTTDAPKWGWHDFVSDGRLECSVCGAIERALWHNRYLGGASTDHGKEGGGAMNYGEPCTTVVNCCAIHGTAPRLLAALERLAGAYTDELITASEHWDAKKAGACICNEYGQCGYCQAREAIASAKAEVTS